MGHTSRALAIGSGDGLSGEYPLCPHLVLGLKPCYEWKEKFKLSSFNQVFDIWRLNGDADGYRLPTEFEWEYACRAGTTTVFSHGDDYERLAAFAVFSQSSSHPCGSKLPNAWGLFDMHGNVQEWCQDWHQYFGSDPRVQDPAASDIRGNVTYRGGSWYFSAGHCRSADRAGNLPWFRDALKGFRIARSKK